MKIMLLIMSFAFSSFSCTQAVKVPAIVSTKPQPVVYNKIILKAFVPTLNTAKCEYVSMLTQSFYYYFVEGLAFINNKYSNKIQVELYIEDSVGIDPASFSRNITSGMKIIKGFDDEYLKRNKITLSKRNNSIIILADEDGEVLYSDSEYRAQGEHLKPLERKIKQLLQADGPISDTQQRDTLKIGDYAPDFFVSKDKKLSDYKGQVILISFYPAAFSGVLQPIKVTPEKIKSKIYSLSPKQVKPVVNPIVKKDSVSQKNYHDSDYYRKISCSVQLVKLDDMKFSQFSLLPYMPEYKKFVVSSSTDSLLVKWKAALGTASVQYVNDKDYSVSKSYFSYNSAGYNNRATFIINKQGRIAYINWHFNFDDDTILEKIIKREVDKK